MLNYLNLQVIKLVYAACNAYECGTDEESSLMQSICASLREIIEKVGE